MTRVTDSSGHDSALRSAPRPGAPTPGGVVWRVRWESTLAAADHDDLAGLLALAFAGTAFAGRSWVGARPELRVCGSVGGVPVAHAGVIRRFLRTSGASTLVGDVGLVAVRPGHRGERLGVALMAAVADALARLPVPFGFLTCSPDLRPFYERCGWTALTGHPLRSITIDHRVEDRRNGMLLPVLSSVAQWPPGPVHRDGQEI